MTNEHTNQHTVPKCYLRFFAFGKERNPKVYVYDKIPPKFRIAPIKDICYEPEIYTVSNLSTEGADMSDDERKKYYEVEYLKKQVEDSYGPCIKDTVSKLIQNKALSVKEKVELAHYMAIQYLRLPVIKPLCTHLQEGVFLNVNRTKEIIEEFEKNSDPNLRRYYNDDAQAHFKNGYGNEGVINTLTCLFGLSKWEVLNSPDNIITSDFPIFVVPKLVEVRARRIFMNKIFEKYVFPISKDYLLTIDINPEASFEQNNLCIIKEATKEELLKFNILQCYFCKRYAIKHIPFSDTEIDYINKIRNSKLVIYD